MSQQTCDREEDDERFVGDENAFISSAASSISSLITINRKFKKMPELNNFFDSFENSTICKACNKHFASRSYVRLLGHLNKCKEVDSQEDVENIVTKGTFDLKEQTMNDLWTHVVLENNISFATSESKSFKKFANTLSRGKWKPPPRDEISSVIIPSLSRRANKRFIERVQQEKEKYLTIEFDHWKDAADRSLLGIVASTIDGNKHLVELIDTSLEGHGGEASLKCLLAALEPIPADAINCVISDSGSGCQKARRELVKLASFSHVIEIRCLAHLFNNIGTRITSKDDSIKSLIADAMKITSFFSTSSYWQAKFADLKLPKIKLATPTRWYSLVNQLIGLLAWKDVIYGQIEPTLNIDQQEILREFDWHRLDLIIQVLKPINYTIGQLERKNINLGAAFSVILDLAKQLFSEVDQPSRELVHARKSFLWYFSLKKTVHEDLKIYVASYAMDPRFNLKYLTPDGVDIALEGILSVAIQTGMSTKRCQLKIIEEFELYIKGAGCYQRSETINDRFRWWQLHQKSGPLARIALRLMHLKASSTNVERTFSTLRGIVGQQRCRLLASSMLHMCRLKILSYPLQKEDTENSGSQLDLDSSLESSLNESAQEEIDRVEECPNWIYQHETDLRASYSRFMKLFDFKRESNQATASSDPVLSMNDVRNLVKKARIEREQNEFGCLIDTDEQYMELDLQLPSQESS